MAAVASPSTMEMETRTTWTVRNLVAFPAASRARGSFMTRLRNCGHTASDHTPATIRTTARIAGICMLVAFEPGLGLLRLDAQGLAHHGLGSVSDLSTQERNRGRHIAFEFDPGAAALGH